MPTFDYTVFYDLAVELLAEFGQEMTLVVESNAGTPSRPIITKAKHAIQAVQVEIEQSGQIRLSAASGASGPQVAQDTKTLLISPAATAKPSAGDMIVDGDGLTLEIVTAKPVNPGGTAVLYKAEVGSP